MVHARGRELDKAITNYAKRAAAQSEPTDDLSFHCLLLSLAQTGRIEEYRPAR